MKRLLVTSMLLVGGAAFAQFTIPWTVETSSVASSRPGDPAFIYSPAAGLQFVVGGDTIQPSLYFWQPGQFPQFFTGAVVGSADARASLVVASSTANNSVLVYEVTDAGITQLATSGLNVLSPGPVALSRNPDGGFELWVSTVLVIEHFAMNRVQAGVAFTQLTPITVPEVPSGLAVDDRRKRLYVAQPNLGVLTVDANGNKAFLLSIDAGRLGTSVGGIDLFLAADGGTYVLTAASNEQQINVHSHGGSQTAFLTALQITTPDGGSGTLVTPKFLDVYERPTPGFPRGVLVVQDDALGNYKLVSLGDVDSVLPLPPPYIPPDGLDAGRPPDAGVSDGGLTDGGFTDAGVRDGGPSGSGGGTGQPSGPAPGSEPPTPSCGCTGGPFAVLPALLMLWWIRRRSTRP